MKHHKEFKILVVQASSLSFIAGKDAALPIKRGISHRDIRKDKAIGKKRIGYRL